MKSYLYTHPVNIEDHGPIQYDTLCEWMDTNIGEFNWNFKWRAIVYFKYEEDKVKFILRWL